MASTVFPVPASGATDSDFASTVPAVQTTYEHDVNIISGIYDITVSLSTNANLVFLSDTAVLLTTTTSGGTATIQLDSTATKLFITTLTGGTANAIVKIVRTAAVIAPDDIGNGTLDTINTTGTYNQTGLLSVLAFGGGAAGGKGGIQYDSGGAGGASGALIYGMVYSNSAVTVTVGAKGTAATSNNTNIVAPTNSSFGNLLTETNNTFYIAGGGRGMNDYEGPNVPTAALGSASRVFSSFNSNSTTGGGGGGRGNRRAEAGAAGAGSGIGTGGTGGTGVASQTNGNPTVKGTAGTGKASGGGGGAATGLNFPSATGRFGGDGADGVVYVLRGF